jgi:hypothetical protein
MQPHREIILQGLQELSNAADSGRDCRVTFTANGHENWLQCTPALVNMDWPFSSAPSGNPLLRSCFGSAGPLEIQDWEPDSYVTFVPGVQRVDELVTAIERTFRELYDLGANYDLSYQLEDG